MSSPFESDVARRNSRVAATSNAWAAAIRAATPTKDKDKDHDDSSFSSAIDEDPSNASTIDELTPAKSRQVYEQV
jgi:hypothetical protein